MMQKIKYFSAVFLLIFLNINLVNPLFSLDTGTTDTSGIFIPYEADIFLPDYLGSIDDVSYGDNGKTIVLIRDIHSDYQSQKKIAEILSYFYDKYNFSQCFVEGLDDVLDLSPISSFPDKSSRKNVAEKYLKTAKISGEEYLEIISPEKYTISGIEEISLYEQNLSVFKKIISNNKNTLKVLENIKAECITQTADPKIKIVLENLCAFLSLRQGADSFYQIIDSYSDRLEPDSKEYPNIDLFLKMNSVRQKINIHSFARENNKILSIIKNNMPKNVLDSFRQLSFQFQTNRIPEEQFLKIVKKLSGNPKYNINKEKYPNFNLYLDYITLSRQVEPKNLITELTNYGLLVCGQLSDNKKVIANYKALATISKLKSILLCTLSSEEAKNLLNVPDIKITGIWEDCLAVSSQKQSLFLSENLPKLINLVKEYYRLALRRDKVMAEKIIANANQSQSVCISGGFHTQGMKKQLAENGFTVVTVSPVSNSNLSNNNFYINNIFNRLDSLETRFKLKNQTLRQPALTMRQEHSLALQFNLLIDSVGKLTSKSDILKYLKRIVVEAKVRKTKTTELLDDAVLYIHKNDIYVSFPDYSLILKITKFKDAHPVFTAMALDLIIPSDAKKIDLYFTEIALGFKSPKINIDPFNFEQFSSDLYNSVLFYDAGDYLSFLYILKRLQTRRSLPDETIRLLIYEAVLDYVGYDKPDEFTSEIISERILEAEGFLKYIFKNESHRKNFVRFFANYRKINIYYNNYLTPLFISAFNIADNKPVNSTELLKIDYDLFSDAATISYNPWFTRARLHGQKFDETTPFTLEPVNGKLLPGNKKQLRILILGSNENRGQTSPAKILKSYMDNLPDGLWDEIVIETMCSSFLKTVYPFDSATGKLKEAITVFPFDKNGKYRDDKTGIVYREMKRYDVALNPLHPNFKPQSEYDIVISSDLGLETFNDQTDMNKAIHNLTNLLADKGVLVLGMGELGYGKFIQRNGETIKTLFPMIPFFNLPATELKFNALKAKVSFINPADNIVIKTAVDLHRKFQTADNPAFDVEMYMQFLAVFGEDPATLAAFILQGVPKKDISNALPVLADKIFSIQENFYPVSGQARWQHLFPHIINLLPSNPDNWIVKEGGKNTVEQFKNKTNTETTTIYDNGIYRFEIGYYKKNAVVFVTKSAGEVSSTKIFIVSNIAYDSIDAVYQGNVDTVFKLLTIAEKEDFGKIPHFLPDFLKLEPDAEKKYDGYWNPQWVRPSPKYLHIAQFFIDKVESLSKKNLILFKDKIYSKEIADMFITHPLIINNSKEGAKIFSAIYYLNPQLAGVIMRSMDIQKVPIFKVLIPNLLNEQVAKMLSFEMQAGSLNDTKNIPSINKSVLLKYLEPAYGFNDEYQKNVGEILQHLDAHTLTTIYMQLYEYIKTDFKDAWAAAILGSIFHSAPLSVVKQKEVLQELPRPASNWLRSRKNQPASSFMTFEELKTAVNQFLMLNNEILNLDENIPIDFDNPSDNLKTILNIYENILNRPLINKDYELLDQIIADKVTIGSKKYDRAVNLLFMDMFNGWTHFDQAGYALESIFRENPDLAGLIIRSMEKGKHFQMGSIIFNMSPVRRTELISNEITALSDKTAKRFSNYDGFAVYVMLNFRYTFQENQNEPHDDIIDLINSLDNDKLRDLISHGYFYYQSKPEYCAFIKDYTKFLIESVGDKKLAQLFAENTPQNNKIKNWINREILELNIMEKTDIAAMLEDNAAYQKIKKTTVKIAGMVNHLKEIEHYIEKGIDNLPDSISENFDGIIFNLNHSETAFQNGHIYRGIKFYGKALDNLDTFVHSNKDFSENLNLRLALYYASKIDSMLAQYIAADKLTRIKSILAYNRNKVVGKLRMIPNDENGFKLLFDKDYLNEGFAVVNEYPQNIAAMAKPRAIIAEKGIGRDEHAAERAADWEIPYIIVPRARKLLSGLVKDGENDQWVTIELGGRTALNVIRRATQEEIEDEIAYRLNMNQPRTRKKVDIIPADLSVRDIQKLEDMDIKNNVNSGNKTSRLGHLKKLGFPVKKGFVLPFGFYDEFSKQKKITGKIQDILSRPDFNENKPDYLAQIRNMILNAELPEKLKQDILRWHKKYLGGKPVIARSSTNAEDLPGYAGAGVYQSYPELSTPEELIEGIKKVYASVWTQRAFDNREEYAINHLDVYPAVLVQEMSFAKFSGVMNTANEINQNRDEMTLSVNIGHGGAVDSLAAEFVYDRKTQKVIEDETDIPEFLLETVVNDLTNEDFFTLDNIGVGVEKEFALPQKIEFSYDENGYWVNQTKDLSSFRKEKITKQPETDPQQDVTQYEVTVLNHNGVYLDTARRITQLTSQSLSRVTIVKMTGLSKEILSSGKKPAADAKDVMELLNLNLKKGNRMQIIAAGSDSEKTVAELTRLVNAMLGDKPHPDDLSSDINIPFTKGLPEEPFKPSPPEYYIAAVNNANGIHALPATNIAKTAMKFSANIQLQKIDVIEENGIRREILSEPADPKNIMDIFILAAPQGSRIKISAQGDDAQKAMAAIRKLFENNLNDLPNDNDRLLKDSIYAGDMLSLNEKKVIDNIINVISIQINAENSKNKSTEVIESIVLDAYLNRIGYFTGNGFVQIDITEQDLDVFQKSVFREKNTKEYIRHILQQRFPNLSLNVFTDKMDDTQAPNPQSVKDIIQTLAVFETSL